MAKTSASVTSLHHDLVLIDRDLQSLSAQVHNAAAHLRPAAQPEGGIFPGGAWFAVSILGIASLATILRWRSTPQVRVFVDPTLFGIAIMALGEVFHTFFGLRVNDGILAGGAVGLAIVTYSLFSATQSTAGETRALASETKTLGSETRRLANDTAALARHAANDLLQVDKHHQEAMMPIAVLERI
jgi:hypothetical protein